MAKDFLCSSTEPVVQTKPGALRGFVLDGIYTFHGIRYAEAKRFQAPKPVTPWEGVKDALSYGHIAPLLDQPAPQGELMVPHRFWPESEHCQYLNIWTTSVDRAAKKPVMVWLHGGGFFAGSSISTLKRKPPKPSPGSIKK
jgi:para-nitrobenzyl esterase